MATQHTNTAAPRRPVFATDAQRLKSLRKRIESQIERDLNRIDRCLGALDLLDGDPDIEQDAGEMAEAQGLNANLDDEPSLCGITVDAALCFRSSGMIAEDGEVCAGDEPEHDEAEISGIGDEEGYAEQFPFLHSGFGAYA
jgi:hypothetical protein